MAFVPVPDFQSDSDISETEETPKLTLTKTKVKLEYSVIRCFRTKADAVDHVKSEKKWRKHFGQSSQDGARIYYACKVQRSCPVRLILFVNPVSQEVEMLGTSENHNHAEKIVGLPQATKDEVRKIFKHGITAPNLILKALESDRIVPVPKKSQLVNFLRCLRVEEGGKPIISLGELEQACMDKSHWPTDLDEAFIPSYKFTYLGVEDSTFRFLLTTRRLLSVLENSENLHVDATYKLLWKGFPVLVVGCSDMDRKFHPIGIAVTSNEKSDDYTFVFNAVKDGYRRISDGAEYSPKTIVGDCAEAITNAAQAAFPNSSRVHCWAHVVRNADKELLKIKNSTSREKIREDIFQLQLSKSEAEFDKASSLWTKKWKNVNDAQVQEFVDYFDSEYICNCSGWFEGHAKHTPSTNNGLEGINGVIKFEATQRNRLPMAEFLSRIGKQLHYWSTLLVEGSANFEPFVTKPTLTLKIQTEAYNWARRNVQSISETKDGQQCIYVQPTGAAKVRESEVTKYKKLCHTLGWKSFDGYVSTQRRFWKVTIVGEEWLTASCTCPEHLKKYVCKHSLGIAVRYGKFVVVPAAKNIPLGEKRKRGRPSKAKKALIRQ